MSSDDTKGFYDRRKEEKMKDPAFKAAYEEQKSLFEQDHERWMTNPIYAEEFNRWKELMAKDTLDISLTKDEDGGYVVECTSIPGCISQGDTIDKALANIADAIELNLDSPYSPDFIAEVEKRAKDVRTGKVKALSREEVMAQVGLPTISLCEIRYTYGTEKGEDGRWMGEVHQLSGCLAYGDTEAEAVAKVKALALNMISEQILYNEESVVSLPGLSQSEVLALSFTRRN